MAHGPAITAIFPPPIFTPRTSTTESARWYSRETSLNFFWTGKTDSTAGRLRKTSRDWWESSSPMQATTVCSTPRMTRGW